MKKSKMLIKNRRNIMLKKLKLYISEALFYFKTANKQFVDKRIFEKGMRKEYIEFIDIVGLSTLKNLFDMYNQSYSNLKELSALMGDNDNEADIENISSFLISKEIDLKEIEKNYLKKKNRKH